MRERFREKKIGVLYGGESSEREVSLKTGTAILNALKRRGYDAVPLDMRGDWGRIVVESGIEVAYIALHGKWGEDGALQGMLEVMRIPYTGSGVAASSLSMSKVLAKKVLQSCGVRTAEYVVLERGKGDSLEEVRRFGLPAVVKPDREGSTIGVSIVREEGEIEGALKEAFRFDERVLVERYVPGREITVGIVNGRVLPAIEIVPAGGFYDYTAKYTKGMTEYLCPAPLDAAILDEASEATVRAASVIGLRGGARLDFRVDEEGKTFFLEINTIPGMTETSLLPKAAAEAGMSFDDLVEEILFDAGLDK
ncbi:MAG: D-alanine--D-alanine ligase [Deltaproteobacteria bacterium]|nr:MAG: D-alanine--D-alanine ligase [Deltaproteobacteria bacterium]